ncbi:MAG: DUF21 domain-containing protein [Actinobacteria bacterium]|uniref:Unannotated protein n=1 Tax=freshwater metagenome TaxID=449393 RepID=A0A6J7GB14_9ZZZZ|nr:DUF21 domain-containing protein [Actinomycetota bacterium]
MSWLGFVWLALLLVINAFFVAAEFAVISARRSQIEPLADAGKPGARTALWAIEHASLMLATSQLGITVCSLLILNVAEPSIHDLVAEWFSATGLPYGVISTIGFLVALVFVTFLHVVFGELVPKNASFSMPDRAVRLLAPALVAVASVVRPIIVALNWASNMVLRICRVTPRDEASSTFTLDQVASIVNLSQREGTIDDATGAVSATFEFTIKKARDIAVVLTDVVTLPENATVADLERAVTTHGFSRYPVVNTSGEAVGYVHLKDVLTDGDGGVGTETGPLRAKRIRRLETVSPLLDLEDALAQLQQSGVHLARVVDASGRTTGMIFLEDILEELIGRVDDATRR